MTIRTNDDIKSIVIHHTQDVTRTKGERLNVDYAATPNYFGVPYDIIINKDGTVDLAPRWILAVDKGQYMKDVSLHKIFKYKQHYVSAIGETDDIRKEAIHIGVTGDFDSQKVTKAQLYKLVEVLKTIISTLNINPKTHLFYHSNLTSTSCPGFYFPQLPYLINLVKDSFS